MVYALEQIIASYRPDWFVLPEPRGFHQEHRAVAEAAISALRPEGATERFRPPVVVVYEEPSDYWTIGSDAHKPSLFVSIDDEDLDKKCRAMELHVTQARPIPSERSVEAIRGLATLRGAQAGVKYAEAYEVRRCLL
jgi:LmbE family N-acetylglucosaminyl deacetylase